MASILARKKIEPSKYIMVLLAAALIFALGLYLGFALSGISIKKIAAVEEELRLQLFDIELQNLLFEKNPCNLKPLYKLGEEMGNLAANIGSLESEFGKNDVRVKEAKIPFFLLEIRHFLLFKEAKEKCNENITLILYFYSNDPRICRECETQGFALTAMQRKYGYEELKIYSFDINADSGAVETLQELYAVEEVPTIVINDKTYIGFHDLNTLEKLQDESV